jgi:hypothetical protein
MTVFSVIGAVWNVFLVWNVSLSLSDVESLIITGFICRRSHLWRYITKQEGTRYVV